MTQRTSIEWTQGPDGAMGVTWNPAIGCSRVSPGCENCWAEKMAARLSRNPGAPEAYRGVAHVGQRTGWHAKWSGTTALVESALDAPLRWRKPRRVAVALMGDLFHESRSDEDIAAVFGVMAAAPQHTFQVLTKRAARMLAWFEWVESRTDGDALDEVHFQAQGYFYEPMPPDDERLTRTIARGLAWPLPNVWLGVSVEDQARAEERIPNLLACPAAVRWVSAEPLLGPLDLGAWLPVVTDDGCSRCGCAGDARDSASDPAHATPRGHLCPPGFDREHIGWVVVGGESGPKARPFRIKWARALIEQCARAGTPCFMKQLGANLGYDQHTNLGRGRHAHDEDRTYVIRDPKGGDPAEWPEDLRVRQFPEVRHAL